MKLNKLQNKLFLEICARTGVVCYVATLIEFSSFEWCHKYHTLIPATEAIEFGKELAGIVNHRLAGNLITSKEMTDRLRTLAREVTYKYNKYDKLKAFL